VRNPLAASGGLAPELTAEAKLYAPGQFRKQLARAITAADYARLTEREFRRAVQRAAAELTWTGSWYEANVAVDALSSAGAHEQALLRRVEGTLHRYRRMGHDVAVHPARRVPLDLAVRVCVQPGHLRAQVEAALLDVYGNRALPGGRRGLFHPDSLTFGEPVYLSKLVAAAHAVAGVESVQVTKLQRLFAAPNHEIANGVLPLAPFEVAQLDNDPSFPEHGQLAFEMNGGR
jgi:predicted phage baseplate assembly protein